MISATSLEQTNGAVRVLSAYDHRHRRTRKTIQRLSLPDAAPPAPPPLGEWATTETHTYVWDGNNIADALAFVFSTKPLDRETGLVSYQRRFYRPPLGRFLNRDPIEEEGGENPYAFCENDPMHSFDSLGLDRYITMFDVAGINNLIFEEGRTQGKPFRTNIHVGIAVDVWRKEKDNPKSKCWHWKRTGNEAKNPLSYNFFWRNCIEWSLKAIQYGIGTRPDEGPNDHPRVRY